MHIPLISIGNSKGIRLSKTIIEMYNIQDALELILEKDCIILKPKARSRKGWEQAFSNMHENGDDKLLMEDVFEDEQFEEWK